MSSIDLTLKIWRQKNSDALGDFETYILRDISTDMSFLEMIDVLNEQLTSKEHGFHDDEEHPEWHTTLVSVERGGGPSGLCRRVQRWEMRGGGRPAQTVGTSGNA